MGDVIKERLFDKVKELLAKNLIPNLTISNLLKVGLFYKNASYQFNQLLKDVEKAINYDMKMKIMVDKFHENGEEYNYVCNLQQFFDSYSEFSTFLDSLKAHGSVRQKLKENQALLNETVEITKEIFENPEKINEYKQRIIDIDKKLKRVDDNESFKAIKQIWGTSIDISEKFFIGFYPEWYRAELNYRINRMNMSFDGVIFDMNMRRAGLIRKGESCPKYYKEKMDVSVPIDIDEDIFFDALESFEQE